MDVLRDLFLIVMGIAGSAFFSGVETGLISLNRVRLRHHTSHTFSVGKAVRAFHERRRGIIVIM